MHGLWTEKYAPKKEEEFVGNSEIVKHAIDWARAWVSGERQQPLLIWGQTGSGKTALAYLVAGLFKWDVVELNSSDLRSRDVIEKVVGAASQNASIFGQRRLILLDEVDALSRNDSGGVSAIQIVIKDSNNPVILTANDIFVDKAISGLRFVCKTFEFKKINYISMALRLCEILSAEGIDFDETAVKELSKNSSGDMRSALLDLQTLSMHGKVTTDSVKLLSNREREQKVFSVMKSIFGGASFEEVRNSRSNSDLDSNMLFMWVDENIPRQYSAQEIPLAFDRLSRADVFNGRILGRQYWGFLRYSTELSAEGVAMAREKPQQGFVMYQFPTLLSMLSKSSGQRAIKKSLGKKIGKKLHSSSREIISRDLPYLRSIVENKASAVSLVALCGLDEKEVAFLLDSSPETKKVQAVVEEASLLRDRLAKPKMLFAGQPVKESLEANLNSGAAGRDVQNISPSGHGRVGAGKVGEKTAQGKPSGGRLSDERQTKLF